MAEFTSQQVIDLTIKNNLAELAKDIFKAKENLLGLEKALNIIKSANDNTAAGVNKLAKATVEYDLANSQLRQKIKDYNIALQQQVVIDGQLLNQNQQLNQTYAVLNATVNAYNNTLNQTDQEMAKVTNAASAYIATFNKTTQATSSDMATRGKWSQQLKSTNNLTLQFNQILRETPNFFLSMRIGLMSLTNNLPLFTDALQEARKAAKEAGAQFSFLAALKAAFNPLTIAITAVSIAMAVLSNNKLMEKIKGWFSSTKDFNNELVKTKTYTELVADAFNQSGNEYSKTIKDINLITLELKNAQKGWGDSAQAVNHFNSTLGDNLGTANSVAQALDILNNKGQAYIEVMKNMTIVTALNNQIGEEAAKVLKIEAANEEQLYNAKFIDKEATDELQKSRSKEWEEIKSKRAKLRDEIDATKSELTKLTSAQGKNIAVGDEYNANAIGLREKYLRDKLKEQNQALADYETQRKADVKKQKEELLKEYNGVLDALNLLMAGKYEEAAKLMKKYNIKLDNTGKDGLNQIKYTIDEYNKKLNEVNLTFYDEEKFKEDLQNIKQSNEVLTAEEEENIRYYNEIIANGYRENEQDKIKHEIKLNQARIKDREKLLNEYKQIKKDADQFILENKDIWEQDTVLLRNRINKNEEIRNNYNTQINEAEAKQTELEKKFAKEKDLITKQSLAKQIEANSTVIKNLKEKKDTTEASIAEDKKQLEITDKLGDKLSKNAAKSKQAGEAIKRLKTELTELLVQIGQGTFKLDQAARNDIANILEMVDDYVKSIGKLIGGLSDIYQADLDAKNQKFDKEKKLIEDSILSEEEKDRRIRKIETQRYNTLKKEFEKNKKLREAETWINFASGTIGIIAGNVRHMDELGGPTSAAILSAIEVAALLATTIASVKQIQMQQLEAPSPAGATQGIAGAATTPVTPTKTSMTSPQENLNQARQMQTSQSWVKVSEINQVQKKVGVREANQIF